MNEPNLIDLKAVASILGDLNPEHVRSRIAKRPDFPRPFRIGGRIFYERAEIIDWVDSQRQAPDGRRTPKSRQH